MFLVENLTTICLVFPSADWPTRCDTAMSLGSIFGWTFICSQILRMAPSVSSWPGFSGMPTILRLSRRPCCSISSISVFWSFMIFFSLCNSAFVSSSCFLRGVIWRWTSADTASANSWSLGETILLGCHFSHIVINGSNRARSLYYHNTGTYNKQYNSIQQFL